MPLVRCLNTHHLFCWKHFPTYLHGLNGSSLCEVSSHMSGHQGGISRCTISNITHSSIPCAYYISFHSLTFLKPLSSHTHTHNFIFCVILLESKMHAHGEYLYFVHCFIYILYRVVVIDIYLQNLWHSRNFINVSLMNILKEFIMERKKK